MLNQAEIVDLLQKAKNGDDKSLDCLLNNFKPMVSSIARGYFLVGGDEEDAWKAAVAENQLPWKHVYNPKESQLTDDYAIQGYPTKIVIDPDGNIAKVFIGEDPAFYEYLDQLFAEGK